VGVTSSRFRLSALLVSVSLDSKEDVLKEVLLGAPNTDDCCGGVFVQEGNDDPVPDPTVTVEPALGSVLKPGIVGF
jgi:hypothetical protein